MLWLCYVVVVLDFVVLCCGCVVFCSVVLWLCYVVVVLDFVVMCCGCVMLWLCCDL